MSARFRNQRVFSSWNVSPDRGEPGHGLFLRMVTDEGLSSARVYARSVGLTKNSLLSQQFIGTLLQLPMPESWKTSLFHWTMTRQGGYLLLAGQKLRPTQVSAVRRRFCPGCLYEEPSHKSWWDIVAFQTCPFHGCPLETTYGDSLPLNWWWADFTTAPDGGPIGRKMASFDGRHLLEHYIQQKLGWLRGTPHHPLLDGAELCEVIEICGHIGRFLTRPWLENAPAVLLRDRPYQVGFEALSGTFDHFVERLKDWLEENREKAIGVGLEKGYGWLRRGQSSVKRVNPRWTALDQAQRVAYAATSRMGRKNASFKTLDFKYLTMVDVARYYGIRGERLREFLVGIRRLPDDLYFTKEFRDEIGLLISRMLTATAAAKRVGCKARMLTSMVSRGLLKGYLGLGDSRRYLFLEEDISLFCERIKAIVPTGNAGPKVSLWTYCAEKRISEVETVRRVLDGELEIAGIKSDAVGLAAIRILTAPPAAAYRSKIGGEEITYGRAKAMLGLSQETIPALAAAGILITSRPGSTRPHLTEMSVRSFQDKYVNAAKYVRDLRCSNMIIVPTLERLGVKRHFCDVPGVKDNIVERNILFVAAKIPPTPPDLAQRWTQFSTIAAEVCPAYLLPDSLTIQQQTFFNITRLTRFTVSIRAGTIVVRKRFSERASREWRWFQTHRKEACRTLAVMNVVDVPKSTDVEGECVLDDEKSLVNLAQAMADYHWLLLKKEIR